MDYPAVKTDWWLIVPAILLISLGLLMLRSIAPGQLLFQAVFTAVAILVFFLFAFSDYQLFFSLHLPAYVLSLALMLLPFLFGLASRGAHRWLQFGQVFFQPSEVAKPFMIITFAVLASGQIKHKLAWLTAAFVLPATLIWFQPDLGTMLVLAIGWLTVFLPQISRKVLGVVVLLILMASPLIWLLLRDYQKDRLVTFVDPYTDPLGRGYQVIQSTIAVGSGQFWGKGLGQGTQSQLQFLPERQTDFMFATLAEELGFVGAATVIALFSWLFVRIYYLARQTASLSANFFCLGVLAMLAFQVFINVGMNMGLAPVTGITLPFLSYGGSSLLSLGITLGLLISISRQNRSLKIAD